MRSAPRPDAVTSATNRRQRRERLALKAAICRGVVAGAARVLIERLLELLDQ